MLKLIRHSTDENNVGFFWAKLATLNADREAVTLVVHVETDDIEQYVEGNEAALEARVLSDGEVDDRLTARLRARDAERLLRQSRLEGKTLAQVEGFIESEFTALTAKAITKELAGQIWMLYQVAELMLESQRE